ncbi:MAG: RsmB/NOP family class I SAM-dependent RNA methyltransferase [Bdellovibrionaceae bacterium]|nr:RsmB/NOP family class I SAM-dependent RNA methyltransferase [Bdellovibrionales bacterium]MCB9085786.1 RsmB/NOP family class I SAM-dependent RNA methyltransferase [Pseudobdellovibrionaceae bacterium]
MNSPQPRLHRPWLYGLIKVLNDTFNGGYYADKVLERHFKENKKMGGRDRRFFAETFYETVRWWRRLRWAAGLPEVHIQGQVSEEEFRQVLVAWFSIHGFDLTPFHDEGWSADAGRVIELWETAPAGATRESYPDWLWEKGTEELGEHWSEVAHLSNSQAPIFLRTNRLKTSPEKLKKDLQTENISCSLVAEFPDALMLDQRANVFVTQAFKNGWFEVQDVGSQTVAPFLQVEPGHRVVDACAGAGGKSLHLAALMNNKGKIMSLDIHEWKLKELRKRASRAGADTIEVKEISSTKVIKRLQGQMDRVLLDVPCSGSGVIRRNPDTKWKLSQEECDRLLQTQKEIFSGYAKMVKSGGKLVYATCSLFPSENRQQVEAFLAAHSEWVLEDEEVLLPRQGLNDGFYAARLKRG